MTTDTIMQTESPVSMLAQVDSMSNWSDQKKDEFAELFSKRAEIARIICVITVSKLAEMAKKRHFISDYHLTKLKRATGWEPSLDHGWRLRDQIEDCGRNVDEIKRIASDRAKSLLAELPPLKKAVQVIDKETAARIGEIEKLKAKAEKLQGQLEELPSQIDMSDPEYQEKTVREFRAAVKALFDRRNKLVEDINKLGKEAHTLEISVSKALYKGLPGLSEAVIDVIKAHIERATALDQMQRRVTEQVKFGDSEAATDLLAQFEKDEAKVSSELKNKLNAAMASLKAGVKALPKKKAKKKVKKGRK